MHGHDVFLRQQEILHREHGLLHFSGVAHAGDQNFALSEVKDDGRLGMGAVPFGVADEIGDVEDFPFGLVGGVVTVWPDEHIAGKQRLPGGTGGDPDREIVLIVLAHVQVLYEGGGFAGEGLDPVPERVKALLIKGQVD